MCVWGGVLWAACHGHIVEGAGKGGVGPAGEHTAPWTPPAPLDWPLAVAGRTRPPSGFARTGPPRSATAHPAAQHPGLVPALAPAQAANGVGEVRCVTRVSQAWAARPPCLHGHRAVHEEVVSPLVPALTRAPHILATTYTHAGNPRWQGLASSPPHRHTHIQRPPSQPTHGDPPPFPAHLSLNSTTVCLSLLPKPLQLGPQVLQTRLGVCAAGSDVLRCCCPALSLTLRFRLTHRLQRLLSAEPAHMEHVLSALPGLCKWRGGRTARQSRWHAQSWVSTAAAKGQTQQPHTHAGAQAARPALLRAAIGQLPID